jgi:hypothetical protein
MYPGGANGNGLGTGLEFFGGGTLTFPDPTALADTVFYIVNIAAPNPVSKATAVTVGVDPNIVTTYNADTNNAVKFEVMPDSLYSFINNSVTIQQGKYLDTIRMIFYPYKFDPTKSYMAPVTITDAAGTAISANFATIYFHTIGNAIAGAYLWDYTRWNNSTGTGTPTSAFTNQPTIFLPDDANTVEVQSGYVGIRYVITFDNNGGVISNIAVAFNTDDLKNIFDANSITLDSGPTILIADPVAGQYKFTFHVHNPSGNRTLIDYYHKN